MFFSFIIPTIDDNRVKNTIQSILSLKKWNSNDCEVIVIVNNCQKSFYKDLLKEFSDWIKKGGVKILFLKKATLAQARNAGITISRRGYIVHIDGDCILEKNYLENLRKNVNKKRFLIGRGMINFIPTQNLISRANCQLKKLAYFSRKDVCYTPNLIVKFEVYKQIGLFDKTLFSGEDTEWSLRSKKFKIKPLFFDDLIIKHFDPENFKRILLNYFYYGVTRVYRFKKLNYKRKKGWKKLKFFWQLFNEIPNLQKIRPFASKLLVIFLYLIRNIGVSYGLLKWRKI